MANIFDQFDQQPAPAAVPPAGKGGNGNVFDQFDNMPAQQPDTPTRLMTYGRKAAGDMAQGIKDMWTGDNRREFDIPELPPIMTQSGLSQDKMALGRDDLRKLDIFRKTTGQNVPAMLDQFGNVIVAIDEPTAGKLSAGGLKVGPGRYYLNRPGASSQDIADTVAGGLFAGIPALLGARGGGKLLGTAGTWIGAGAGSAGGSLLQDTAATAAGSERGVDPTAAAVAAAFGVGAEAAGTVITPFLRRFIFNKTYVLPDGRLTQAGANVLTRAGLDPAAITPEFAQHFQALAKSAADPVAAAGAASGQSLPVRVPLSKGDASRDVTQQGWEDAAQLGQFGDPAKRVMQGFRDQQQTALKQNIPLIQARLGNGKQITVLEPGQGMERVQQTVLDQANRQWDKIGDTYAAARAGNGGVPADNVQGFAEKTIQIYSNEYSLQGMPAVRDAIDELANITKGSSHPALRQAEVAGTARFKGAEGVGQPQTIAQAMGDASAPAGEAVTTIRRLEQWRASVNAAWKAAAPNSVERNALEKLLRDYDGFADDMIKQSLFQGDKDTLALWQQARGLRRDFTLKFDSNDIIANIIKTDEQTGRKVLSATPTEALNYIFTASGAGGKKGAAKALASLQMLLGPNSPEWQALREEGFLRLLKSQGKGNSLDADLQHVFSGDKFATALDTAMRESPEVMRTLYTPEQLALLQQFKNVGLQATNRVRGATNPAGTAGRAALLLRSLAGSGIVGRATMSVLNKSFGWLGEGMDAAAARAATAGGVPKRTIIPTGALPMIGGPAGGQTFDRKRVQPYDMR